jgi:hypothetical protein
MAAAIIPFDRTTDEGRAVYGALSALRLAREQLDHIRKVIIAECNGTTDTAAHFAQYASRGKFTAGDYADANAAAMASWQQIDSLFNILTKASGQGDAAGAALDQACGMHGIV